jgi:DNA-binding transcriptional regulator YhcF (GntR family)
MDHIDRFIIKNTYKTKEMQLTALEMAEELGLSVRELRKRCHLLRIAPVTNIKRYRSYFLQHREIKTVRELARETGCTPKAIKRIFAGLGLSFKE